MKKIAIAILMSVLIASTVFAAPVKDRSCHEFCPYCGSTAIYVGFVYIPLDIDGTKTPTLGKVLLRKEAMTCDHGHYWECYFGTHSIDEQEISPSK